MRRLLLVSNDRVGSRMAGPGIRYYNFARELSRGFDVTLAVPGPCDAVLPGVRVVEHSEFLRMRELRRLCDEADVVVAQSLAPRLMRNLAERDTRAIYDLYDPLMMENLGFYGPAAAGGWQEDEYRAGAIVQEIALATGDAFVCASERQRDLWLGALSVLGRVDLARYADDHELRTLIDVAPFGIEAGEPPPAGEPVLKGVVPGIGERDRVVLWGGGIWNWLDPLTPIRAVARLGRERDDVKLYFLGVRPPNPGVPPMEMTSRAVALAEELGVLGTSVFFNFGWVPYAERHRYLLESDLGVSAHLATVEARFAFRTRLVDCFWARVPVVATAGDTLADLVAARGLGRTVAVGDVDGWSQAVAGLLDDGDEYARARAALDAVREGFAWPRVVEPLARLVEARPAGRPSGTRAAALLADHIRIRARLSLARRGVAGTLRHAGAAVALRTGLRRFERPGNDSR